MVMSPTLEGVLLLVKSALAPAMISKSLCSNSSSVLQHHNTKSIFCLVALWHGYTIYFREVLNLNIKIRKSPIYMLTTRPYIKYMIQLHVYQLDHIWFTKSIPDTILIIEAYNINSTIKTLTLVGRRESAQIATEG